LALLPAIRVDARQRDLVEAKEAVRATASGIFVTQMLNHAIHGVGRLVVRRAPTGLEATAL
jgi:hypothetical protein